MMPTLLCFGFMRLTCTPISVMASFPAGDARKMGLYALLASERWSTSKCLRGMLREMRHMIVVY